MTIYFYHDNYEFEISVISNSKYKNHTNKTIHRLIVLWDFPSKKSRKNSVRFAIVCELVRPQYIYPKQTDKEIYGQTLSGSS